MKYCLGVDGGGTKTEAVLTDETGVVTDRKIVGSSNPNDIGKERMISLLCSLTEGMIPSDATCVDVGMGLSGLGFSGCKDELATALKNIKTVGNVDLCSDVQIALDSAYDGDGCIAITGTGAVGYLRKDGEHILVGGGGYMIDSSFSGYDLGREALNAALSETDGRGAHTAITSLTLQRAAMPMGEIVKTVYQRGKAYVASFAPVVFEAYDGGDEVAKEILRRRMAELETLLLGVYSRYGKPRCEITLFGGLNRRVASLTEYFSADLRQKVTLVLPQNPVVYGALKRARGGENDGRFLAAFTGSYHV